MSAQGIYVLKPIVKEEVFDDLCETLEEYGVEIISPAVFTFEDAASGEVELILSAPEETLEELKEELETLDLIESVNIVDSFEGNFESDEAEETDEETY